MGETNRDNDLPQFCDACFTGEYPIPLSDQEKGQSNTQMSFLAGLK